MHRLSRRRFLALLGLFAAGTATGIRLVGEGERAPSKSAPRFAKIAEALFDDPDAARQIGDAYLASRPDERDARLLARKLSAGSPALGRALNAGDVGAVRSLAPRRAARDFSEGRLVTLGGWLVAPTEAQLAALATYSSP